MSSTGRFPPLSRHLSPARGLAGRVLVACACLVALGCAVSPAFAQTKSVLVLSSESPEMPASALVVRDAVAMIRAASPGPVNVYTESMERSRFPGDDRRLLALLEQRYLKQKPDLIVAVCAPAVDYVLRHRLDLFRDVPLLYAFVDERMVHALRSPPVTSGVAIRTDFVRLAEVALKLHPNVRRLVVASGTAEFDLGWLDSFHQAAPQIASRVAVRYLTDQTVPELLGDLATLPGDSLVLYLSMCRDREGAVYVPRDVLEMIRRVSRVPVYGPSLTYIGHGAVGGPVMDIEAHGKALGRLAVRVLSGESVSAIKPEVTPSRLVFDRRELDRFGISEAALPQGSEVRHQQSDWLIRRNWIVAVLCLVVAQTALIVALVVQHRKRAALQRSLDDRLGFGTLLSDVSTALNAVALRSLDGTIRSVLERVRQYFDVDDVAILESSDAGFVCRARASAGTDSRPVTAACALVATPFGSLRLASFQPLVLDGPDDLPRDSPPEHGLVHESGIQSLAMVALEVGGQVLGVLCGLSLTKRAMWTAEPLQQLRTLAEVLASALQRQQTAATVSESDRLKGAILSSMAAHITVLDRRGTIIAVNEAWTAFGRANGVREEASISTGASYLEVCRLAAEGGDQIAGHVLEGIQSVCDARTAVFELEYRCDAPADERWFHMKVVPLRRPEGGVVVTHRDISDQRRQEHALRESEERFRRLGDVLPVGVWMADVDGRCIYVNRTWLEWTGRPLERELGDGWLERIHANDLARAARASRDAFAARRAFSTEFRLQRPDGQFRWVLNHGRPRLDDDGELLGYVGGCIDMTERFEAQTRLRELSGRLIRAQEEERRRVARELHDDLQQRLALLAIELEGLALGRPLGGDTGWAVEARRLWTRTNEIASEVHRISHRLLPLKLETLGLLSTVDSYCKELGQQGVRVVFSPENVPAAVPDEVALCTFRVLQESLRNVVKHSGSPEAHVSLKTRDGALVLAVSDFGRGFDVHAAASRGGLGLLSMRERLRLVGGEIDVQSTTGNGTRVEMRVPLPLAGAAAAAPPAGREASTLTEAS